MSSLKNKFLEEYSVQTLRDVDSQGLNDDFYLVFDSTDGKFKPVQVPFFGRDFARARRVGQQDFSGNIFQTYETITFEVTSATPVNEYRFFANYTYSHNSASNDIRIGIVLDGGSIVKEIRLETKDAGTDQRVDGSILFYFENLSIGTHTVDLVCRPASASRVSKMYEADLEVWRCR